MALCPILFPKILTTCGAVVIITVIIIGDHFTDEETEILLLCPSAAEWPDCA